jgi:hypothetical protein
MTVGLVEMKKKLCSLCDEKQKNSHLFLDLSEQLVLILRNIIIIST